jgi:hypothetical protein
MAYQVLPPGETMFMLMLIHLEARINGVEEKMNDKASMSSSVQ